MERGTRNLLVGLLLAIILVGVGSGAFFVGLSVGRAQSGEPAPASGDASPTPSQGSIREQLDVFQEVYDIIQAEFYGDIPSDTDLVYGAIRGMLQRLDDRNTAFLEPAIAEIDRESRSGSYGGIGAIVDLSEGQALEIVRVFRGTPAEQQGIRAGDVVTAVDGRSIIGLSLDEMVALVRGPSGSQVRLTIERADTPKPFEVVVTRADIVVPLVEQRMIGADIAYINLSSFDNPTAVEQLSRDLQQLLARNPKGLILDLRGNRGGLLDQAIAVSDLFLDEGLVAIERERDGSEETFRSDSGDLAEAIPLVVLVDAGSASASEIVAGAVQDRERGVLIGTTTFGKGSVQRINTLSDGSELRVTIARWFTPDDRAIHGEGLEPDITVEAGDDPNSDPQLDRAVEYLRTGK
jgi:carboxyl-terminal processing protease